MNSSSSSPGKVGLVGLDVLVEDDMDRLSNKDLARAIRVTYAQSVEDIEETEGKNEVIGNPHGEAASIKRLDLKVIMPRLCFNLSVEDKKLYDNVRGILRARQWVSQVTAEWPLNEVKAVHIALLGIQDNTVLKWYKKKISKSDEFVKGVNEMVEEVLTNKAKQMSMAQRETEGGRFSRKGNLVREFTTKHKREARNARDEDDIDTMEAYELVYGEGSYQKDKSSMKDSGKNTFLDDVDEDETIVRNLKRSVRKQEGDDTEGWESSTKLLKKRRIIHEEEDDEADKTENKNERSSKKAEKKKTPAKTKTPSKAQSSARATRNRRRNEVETLLADSTSHNAESSESSEEGEQQKMDVDVEE